MKDLFELPYFYFRTKWFNWKEEKKVGELFYADEKFRALDRALLNSENPYKVAKAFPYGETPLTGFKKMAEMCGLGKEDHVYELGCGRGRGALFLAHHYGCKVTAIDWEPRFIEHAQKVAGKFDLKNVTFLQRDYQTIGFPDATVVYLYGTCLDEASVAHLAQTFKTLRPKAKILSVSAPIPGLHLMSEFSLEFPWGQGEVYLQEVIPESAVMADCGISLRKDFY